MILEQQIPVVETALERFFHDLVVTMIFALIPKRSFPGIAILHLTQLHNCHGAFGEWDAVSVRHWEGMLFYRATLATGATVSEMSF
jgi:hypothetical protein